MTSRVLAASLLLAVAMAGSPASSQSAGQRPAVPARHVLVDLIADNGFETSVGGFEPNDPSDGSVAQTAISPISGAQSLHVQVNAYGRVVMFHDYPYEGGPFARS